MIGLRVGEGTGSRLGIELVFTDNTIQADKPERIFSRKPSPDHRTSIMLALCVHYASVTAVKLNNGVLGDS